jgi:hypothetical protein
MGGRTNGYDAERNGQLFAVSDDLVQSERWRFTISEISCEFHKFRALLSTGLSQLGYAIKSFAQDGFRKCSRVRTKRREWSASVDFFLERYHKDGYEFLSHIVRVTGDETWVSFVNVETNEQSKQWRQTHSQNKPKMFQQMLSARS